MKLPEVRDALHEIAGDLISVAEKIKRLAEETRKRPAHRKAPAKARPISQELEESIMEFARQNPKASQFEIGKRFGVNQGRVSETLRGKRQ